MQLIREGVSFEDIEIISESNDATGEKTYLLKGPFLEANVKNRNGRTYMLETLQREVKEFYENKIKNHRAVGELDHPPEPTINLDRISHIITDLKMDENIGYGCARLMDTPMGRIAKTLIDNNVQLGMSTRGVGTLQGSQVNDDYKLITVDVVADPSAPSAFVEGVLENKEYIIKDTGEIVEAAVQQLHTNMDKISGNHYSKEEFSEHTLAYLDAFLKSLHV